jgi:hypothetical protein
MDNIKIVRLQNGEDLIGDITFRADGSFNIYEPMVVEIDFRGKHAGLVMHHWLPLQLIKKNEITLMPKDIIFITEPTDDFSEYYMHTVERLQEMLAAKDELKTMLSDMDDSDSDDLIEQFDKLNNDNNVLH